MSNRLNEQTSPYLLQHADNPVDWQPWDEQALEQARSSGKPILLSIGYSACHWCHVMAHESFENATTAAVMNNNFVCIKVDREERPDLDKVYQLAHQLLTQQTGGWPLTMFLDPDSLIPFFGGTYFPDTPRHQLPGFADLLRRIHEVYSNQRDELNEQGQRISKVLQSINDNADDADDPEQSTDAQIIDTAQRELTRQYDRTEGGFGSAPKFPMPGTLERLLRYSAFARRSEPKLAKESLEMVMTTLTKMARGGIYDHLGGGFCRYSVDQKWMIPHFEKMLYDNGQLLGLYADALMVNPDELFTQAVSDTIDWLLREMLHPQGGFYAALDADSEGEEGKFYVWRRDRVKRLLDEDEYLIIETLYGLDKPANFEGKWNLHRYDAWRSVVERLSLERATADSRLASAKSKLLAERDKRTRPALDDKILSAWNGLTVKGLAKAGAALRRPDWIAAAQRCTDFVRESMWDGQQLFATWKTTDARYPGYLDDYANMLDGLLSLLSAQWREVDAAFALQLAEAALSKFFDDNDGGFFFTTHDHEQLIYRPKPTLDDALPPGNGTMTLALIQLGHLFGKHDFLDAAERTLRWSRSKMTQYPAGHCTLISALELQLHGLEQIIIRGPQSELAAWQAITRSGYAPARQSFAITYEGNRTLPAYLPKLVSSELRSRTVAYRCQGFSCSLPIESLDALRGELSDSSS